MAGIVDLHKKLLAEWHKDAQRSLSAVEAILVEIKSNLTSPDAGKGLDDKALNTVHRDVYEISALSAALREDFKSFDSAIEQVMSFYASSIVPSDSKYHMIGLNLIHLIASSRLSDFHMLLEQVSQNEQKVNPYIAVPVAIEQSLMEGNYNKVALSEKNIPSPFFVPFFRAMTESIRADIAACMAKSHTKVPVSDAVTLLLFQTPEEVLAFAKTRNWSVESGGTVLAINTLSLAAEKQVLEPCRIAKQTIFYAKQLEQIP